MLSFKNSNGNFSYNSRAVVFFLCLFIALLFWALTALNKIYTMRVMVPVGYKNVPFSLEQEKPLPDSIAIDIEASGYDLIGNNVLKNNGEIVIDFRSTRFGYIDGYHHVAFSTEKLVKEYFPVPDPAFKIIRAFPDSIVFDYSKKITLKVPVKLNLDIHFKKQFFQSSSAVIIPDSVEIAGEENELQKITFIETQSVSFKNADKNITFSARLINPLNKIILSENNVHVTIPVEEFTEGKIFVAIDKAYYGNKYVSLLPGKVAVTYRVSLAEYSSFSKNDFEVGIENMDTAIENRESKLHVIPVKYPQAARILSIQPELVDYLIEE